ncbi:hypothetical protein [Oscillatoria acuminata]|uniref:hypothetical protein n=1 Tax=Oscillatoria acuminata TaxID=118323 RepID=UPI0012EA4532|nr:hypothetical protein [Oscillatoria acuminata]
MTIPSLYRSSPPGPTIVRGRSPLPEQPLSDAFPWYSGAVRGMGLHSSGCPRLLDP